MKIGGDEGVDDLIHGWLRDRWLGMNKYEEKEGSYYNHTRFLGSWFMGPWVPGSLGPLGFLVLRAFSCPQSGRFVWPSPIVLLCATERSEVKRLVRFPYSCQQGRDPLARGDHVLRST